MYTFIRGINIHVCQPFVNLREMVADYVQLTKRPFLGWHTFSIGLILGVDPGGTPPFPT